MFENVALFAGLSKEDLSAITQHAVTRNVPARTVVLTEGERSDSLYVILYGKVKVYVNDEHGSEVVLNIQGTGESFGEMALIDDVPRSASVMTIEDSRLSIISRASFRDCLARNPGIALNLIRQLTLRVRTLSNNIKTIALEDVPGRVAHTLRMLASKHGDSLVIEPKPTQQMIANMIGASREMVSRVLNDFDDRGYLRIEGRRITLTDKLPPKF
jgi:CRP/FNR family cyclic AMP-dependent transcriptional regulator